MEGGLWKKRILLLDENGKGIFHWMSFLDCLVGLFLCLHGLPLLLQMFVETLKLVWNSRNHLITIFKLAKAAITCKQWLQASTGKWGPFQNLQRELLNQHQALSKYVEKADAKQPGQHHQVLRRCDGLIIVNWWRCWFYCLCAGILCV